MCYIVLQFSVLYCYMLAVYFLQTKSRHDRIHGYSFWILWEFSTCHRHHIIIITYVPTGAVICKPCARMRNYHLYLCYYFRDHQKWLVRLFKSVSLWLWLYTKESNNNYFHSVNSNTHVGQGGRQSISFMTAYAYVAAWNTERERNRQSWCWLCYTKNPTLHVWSSKLKWLRLVLHKINYSLVLQLVQRYFLFIMPKR